MSLVLSSERSYCKCNFRDRLLLPLVDGEGEESNNASLRGKPRAGGEIPESRGGFVTVEILPESALVSVSGSNRARAELETPLSQGTNPNPRHTTKGPTSDRALERGSAGQRVALLSKNDTAELSNFQAGQTRELRLPAGHAGREGFPPGAVTPRHPRSGRRRVPGAGSPPWTASPAAPVPALLSRSAAGPEALPAPLAPGPGRRGRRSERCRAGQRRRGAGGGSAGASARPGSVRLGPRPARAPYLLRARAKFPGRPDGSGSGCRSSPQAAPRPAAGTEPRL